MTRPVGPAARSACHLVSDLSRDVASRVSEQGLPNDLLDRLRAEPLLGGVDFDALIDPNGRVGRAAEQVDQFIATVVNPIRARHGA